MRPQNLPDHIDDGAASHLEGSPLPDFALHSTDGITVNLANLPNRWAIQVYPVFLPQRDAGDVPALLRENP